MQEFFDDIEEEFVYADGDRFDDAGFVAESFHKTVWAILKKDQEFKQLFDELLETNSFRGSYLDSNWRSSREPNSYGELNKSLSSEFSASVDVFASAEDIIEFINRQVTKIFVIVDYDGDGAYEELDDEAEEDEEEFVDDYMGFEGKSIGC